jgi:Domain of unknown function (DUF1902)
MMDHYKIEAFWDQEAQVWVAESSDILGLVTEADLTFHGIFER